MRPKSLIGSTVAVVAALGVSAGVVLAVQPSYADEHHRSGAVAALRQATDKFHSIAVAEQSGYAMLTDAAGIACIANPPDGAMGVHWANSTLVGDPAIQRDTPEAIVYAPDRTGTLRIAALEYVVLKDAWDATHSRPPRLFGHMFMTTNAPNRYGLPAFYSLHAWVWKHNPAGTFAMWNPRVVCPS
jgi:hypothetical protein